ncbi:18243_t:CDS:1, partial [Gigaspora margarita]
KELNIKIKIILETFNQEENNKRIQELKSANIKLDGVVELSECKEIKEISK